MGPLRGMGTTHIKLSTSRSVTLRHTAIASSEGCWCVSPAPLRRARCTGPVHTWTNILMSSARELPTRVATQSKGAWRFNTCPYALEFIASDSLAATRPAVLGPLVSELSLSPSLPDSVFFSCPSWQFCPSSWTTARTAKHSHTRAR